jgi:hypothetical protein
MLFDHLEDEDEVELLVEGTLGDEEVLVDEVMAEEDLVLDVVEDTTDR